MSDLDNAWAKYLRDTTGRQRPRFSDLEAGFRAGWAAAMRSRGASGEQGGLFGPDGPAWTPAAGTEETRETSLQAAASVAAVARRIRAVVLAEIAREPGTDQQIAERLGLPENTVRPRRIELERDGRVVARGQARNRSGRRAIVWGAVNCARVGENHETMG